MFSRIANGSAKNVGKFECVKCLFRGIEFQIYWDSNITDNIIHTDQKVCMDVTYVTGEVSSLKKRQKQLETLVRNIKERVPTNASRRKEKLAACEVVIYNLISFSQNPKLSKEEIPKTLQRKYKGYDERVE